MWKWNFPMLFCGKTNISIWKWETSYQFYNSLQVQLAIWSIHKVLCLMIVTRYKAFSLMIVTRISLNLVLDLMWGLFWIICIKKTPESSIEKECIWWWKNHALIPHKICLRFQDQMGNWSLLLLVKVGFGTLQVLVVDNNWHF